MSAKFAFAAAIFVAPVCGAGEAQPKNAPAAAATVAPAAAKDPVDIVRRWIEDVRSKSVANLVAASHIPFTEEGVRDKKCKAKRVATTPADLTQTLECITKRALLIDSIPEDPQYIVDLKAVALKDVHHKDFIKKLTPFAQDHVIVTGGLAGDGITYDLAFAVRPDGTIEAAFGYAEATE